MPRKTAKRICTLLIGVAAMLPFARTASADCGVVCSTVNLGCKVQDAMCACKVAVLLDVICDDGTSTTYEGPCCSCT